MFSSYISAELLSSSLLNPCKSIAHLQRAPKHINRAQDIISFARLQKEDFQRPHKMFNGECIFKVLIQSW